MADLMLEDHILCAITEAGYVVVPVEDLRAAQRQLLSPFPKEEVVIAKLHNRPTPAALITSHITAHERRLAKDVAP